MALVLIRCPRTDRCFSIGVETDPDTLSLLFDGRLKSVECPYCRREHGATKHNALLVDPNRWSDVPEAEDCYIRANANSERAASAKKPELRDFYLRMERKWLGMADGYRWMADVEKRHR